MGRQLLFELIPYRGAGRLQFFSLSTAALLFYTHQINKAIQHSRVAVQDITTTDGFGVLVGNGLSPFLIASGVAPIPVLKLDRMGATPDATKNGLRPFLMIIPKPSVVVMP